MEYTKDIILNVQYDKNILKGKHRMWREKVAKVYKNNKFIIISMLLAVILIGIDLCMLSNFITLILAQ